MTVRERDRGATLLIVAVLLPALILMTAFAVDLGRQRSSRRTMQARADIVALDMVRLANGRNEAQILADSGYVLYLQQSADRNNVEAAKLTIEWGNWNGTDSIACRLSTDPPSSTCVPDAVEVIAQESTEYFFQPGSGSVTRTAVAIRDDLAALTLGSTVAEAYLGNAALLDPVLTGLLCSAPAVPPPVNLCATQANVGAGGYQGLGTHDVTLDDLKTAGGFGSVDELLQADFTAAGFAQLAGQAFRNDGDPNTAELYDGQGTLVADGRSLAELSSSVPSTFKLDDVMNVQSPANGSAAAADVNPFNVFVAGLEAANGSNFVDLSNAVPALSLPVGISNLALTSRYQIIQAPDEGRGRVGSNATTALHTAQVHLVQSLTFDINLSNLGTGVTGRVTLPVDVSGGGAVATLTAIDCTQPDTSSTIDVTVAPRAVTGTVGTYFSNASPATIGNVNLTVAGLPVGVVGLSAYGAIDPALQTTAATALAGIAINETRPAPGSNLTLAAITNVELQTPVVGASSLDPLIQTTINDLLTALDVALAPALGVLGVSVSSSDVHNLDVDCQAVRLAA